MANTRTTAAGLRVEIERAGYYPDLVADAVVDAVAGEEVRSYLVHQETTFDSNEVRRHITVLVLTPTRLVVGHTDDSEAGEAVPVAITSMESIPLARICPVIVTRTVTDPASYVPGEPPQEVTVTIGWGAVSHVDLEPATCGDPGCEADHGYTGNLSSEDLALRVSRDAEGGSAVTHALSFAAALSGATADRLR